MKRIITVFFISLLSFTILQAQSGESKLTIEEIISKVAEAMGGSDKIKQVETLSYHSIYPDHGTTPSIVEIMRPDKSRNPKYDLVFDGIEGCFLKGLKDNKEPVFINEEELNDFVVEIALHFPAFFDYPTKLVDSVMINFKETYHLQTSLPRNLTIDYYVDKEKFLPIKASAEFRIQGKNIIWDRIYNDYKSVDGLLFPHRFTYPGKDGSVLYAEIVKIEINTIAEDVFTIPDDILKQKEN